jgi:hypothetical protein
MFDCSGMACSEAGFHTSIAILRGFKLHHYRALTLLDSVPTIELAPEPECCYEDCRAPGTP